MSTTSIDTCRPDWYVCGVVTRATRIGWRLHPRRKRSSARISPPEVTMSSIKLPILRPTPL
jgi:hypothetical protein